MKIGTFKIPNKATITARTSSLTNSFIASIMPYVKPSLEDFSNALKILEMDMHAITCIYCGGKHTEWDHLRPFVDNKRPTGFYTTIYNLVPACGKCNQSKGNKDWEIWIKHQNFPDLKRKIRILKKYAKMGNLKPLNVETLVGKETFGKYMALCDEIIEKMKEAHKVSRDLNKAILKTTELSPKRTTKNAKLTGKVKTSNEKVSGYFCKKKDVLPIKFVPPEPEFKKMILKTHRAQRCVTYIDGHVETELWRISQITEKSNIIGNLRSIPKFRQGNWQKRGIKSVTVKVLA